MSGPEQPSRSTRDSEDYMEDLYQRMQEPQQAEAIRILFDTDPAEWGLATESLDLDSSEDVTGLRFNDGATTD